eukprot:Opistho-2@4358
MRRYDTGICVCLSTYGHRVWVVCAGLKCRIGCTYIMIEQEIAASEQAAGNRLVVRYFVEKILETSPLRFGGTPATCSMEEKFAIIIPFRNRNAHLAMYIKYMSWYFAQQPKPVCVEGVYVIEQYDDAPFNKGWLMNAGYDILKRTGITHYVFNDVDFLPVLGVDYGVRPLLPTQLSSEADVHAYRRSYLENTGGCWTLTADMMERINGYSNKYLGWGGEDDDFYQRLVLSGLIEKDKSIGEPPRGKGMFVSFDGEDHTPRNKVSRENLDRLRAMEAGSDIWRTDGLSDLSYNLVGQETHIVEGLSVIRVRVNQL